MHTVQSRELSYIFVCRITIPWFGMAVSGACPVIVLVKNPTDIQLGATQILATISLVAVNFYLHLEGTGQILSPSLQE